ncbi:elongation factor P--(R)-beta-lysine ligase [Paraglaciecola sp.]|uniref:elongation factor P--(R)-beta-lysine ligase n=1 Tax=Paraglaciecola sp. TaxID=1920173 RepID=UPI003EF47ED5
MTVTSWQPSAAISTLKKRANILQKIRQFFADRNVLEVDTPALSQHTVTDEHLHSFSTSFQSPFKANSQTLYLQTSPEFAMKRLLCAGSGAIYQICKSFRNEEAGRFHNPEFTMLEWYRPDFDHHQLMAEMNELIQLILNCGSAEKLTYQEAFEQHLACDPISASLADLQSLAGQHGFQHLAENETNKDTLLMLLFSQKVEPKIGQERPCFVYDFPASQAALAKINPLNTKVAERFELYFKGVELANGFHELDDATEQLVRFEADNKKRKQQGLAEMPIDQNLIEALKSGLPACAGVALGIDRLVMLALQVTSIDQVLAFEHGRA